MKKRLKAARRDQIGWFYLIYIIAPEVEHKFICRREIRKAGIDILRKHRHLCKQFSKDDLAAFARDLTAYLEKTLQHEDDYTIVENVRQKIIGKDWHSEAGLELPNNTRHRIAYEIVIALTHQEYWWLGSHSEEQVRRLKYAHALSLEESKEFLEKLIRDVHRLNKKFRPLAAPN